MSSQGNILKSGWTMLKQGDYLNLLIRIIRVGKKIIYYFFYHIRKLFKKTLKNTVSVVSDYKVAVDSPDHLFGHGTKIDNSTSKLFIIKMNKFLKKLFSSDQHFNFLDLGCSGGGLVKDFLNFGFLSIGLEGSDYSLINKRAEWKNLSNKNLFTCDISKRFSILKDGLLVKFHLITAWEVLEHIKTEDLPRVFENICIHLQQGGFFIASTSCFSDTTTGVELHQTRMTNNEWHNWIKNNFNHLLERQGEIIKYYENVRYSNEKSFLIYKRK